jgi:DNA repair protein SbcD/Mre11
VRFLHTGDWHVGKRLRGRSRDEETVGALDQVVEMARDSQVDAVLIAGDVYEHRTVAPEADQIVFETLMRLRDAGAHVVLIPGNHDSWQRWEALGRLLTPLEVTVVPRVLRPADGGVVEVSSRDGSEAALIACVPFVPERRFGDAASLFDDRASAYTAYDEGMGAVFAGMARAFRGDRVNVLLAHTMIDGARTGGGEQELTIGMTYAVSPARVPATASYVALGHLHRPQPIRAAPSPTRFAGSLLQLDFGEVEQDKSVVLVEAKPGKPPKVRELPLTAGRKLLDVSGTLDQVLAAAEQVGDAYLRVYVQTEGPVPGLADRVRETLPNAIWVEPVYERQESPRPEAAMRTLAPREQFLHYFRYTHGADPDPDLTSAFDRVYAEVAEGAGAE